MNGVSAVGIATKAVTPAVRVEMLGPLRLFVGDEVVDVPGPKRRAVLALLAGAGERLDNAFVTAGSRVQLGTLALERGQVDAARDLLDEELELSVATNSTQTLTLCFVAFARLAVAEGEPERAALVAGAAQGLRQRAGLREWPTQRQRDADLIRRIGDVLGAPRSTTCSRPAPGSTGWKPSPLSETGVARPGLQE
jgi:hypothetical protein